MNSNYILRDYNVNDIRDAERLGKMFGTFDSVWPGGFTNGVEPTPEFLFESMRRMQRLAICVVEYQDEMVGYCDLHTQTGNTDLAYIPLLGASPDHHGKGVGKSLLLEMIRRVTALGYRELTLDTWAGNTKAVPLYKKTGFNWEPETNVQMRNFLPGLLNSAPGKAFFSGRDWYNCQDRVVETVPDDVKWNGMRVFPYTFRDGGHCLKATFEMASGGMTALETNDYSVWCSIPTSEGEAPAGETLPISWHVCPKTKKPIELILLTEADEGLEVKVREHLRITQPTDVTREIRVLPDAEPRHRGERERCVRSTLVINGVPIVLETGVVVVRPISIDFAGQGLFLGRQERIDIRLKSNLDRPVNGTLSLDAHAGLSGAGAILDFTLPARLSTQCTFQLTGVESGVCMTSLRYEVESYRGTRPLAFRVFGSVAPVTSIDASYDEEIIQESPGMKMTHALRGGMLTVKNKSAGHSWRLPMPEPGPPFATMRRQKLLMTGWLEQAGADSAVLTRAEYPEVPGLVLERKVTQMAGDLVRIDFRLLNTTALNIPVKLRLTLSSHDVKWLALPVEGEIVREPTRDWDPFPMGGQDAMKTIDSLTEGWIAAEFDHKVSGIIWHGHGQLEVDWRTGLTLDAGEVCANSSAALPPVYAVVGAGDWETVRGWWRKLVQPSHIEEKVPPKAKRALRIRTSQSPLLLTADETKVDLLFDNDRGRALMADIVLEAPRLIVDPSEFSIEGVKREVPERISMNIKESGGYGAGFIRAAVNTESNSQEFKLPVIRLASPGVVNVIQEADGRYRVQNGVLSFMVAPEFMGSITTLEAEGVHYLHSSWPKVGSFVWANPWYGGIHPFLDWIGDDKLARETVTGEPTERVGETGLKWQGMRVICEPKHRDLRWLKIEAEYLTLPGSDLMALVCRLTNFSSAQEYLYSGIAIWSGVGGDRGQAVAHWSNDGELRHRRRSRPGMDINDARWAVVENGVTGHRLEAVATGAKGWACINDMSEEGVHIGVGGPSKLEPGETRETICWLIVNPAVSEFEAYAALRDVTKLP